MDARASEPRAEPQPGLLSEPRRRRILEWLQEEGSARVRDLAAAFQVSEATIRQDLERLEGEGHVKREHGGAHLNAAPAQPGLMVLHHQENMDRKRRIGARAALLGNQRMMEGGKIDPSPLAASAEARRKQGETVMFLGVDGKLAGLVAVAVAIAIFVLRSEPMPEHGEQPVGEPVSEVG